MEKEPISPKEHRKLLKEFNQLNEQYLNIINETDPDFLQEKKEIEEKYQPMFKQLLSYERQKRNLIEQEGRFHQQIINDDIEFQNFISSSQ